MSATVLGTDAEAGIVCLVVDTVAIDGPGTTYQLSLKALGQTVRARPGRLSARIVYIVNRVVWGFLMGAQGD